MHIIWNLMMSVPADLNRLKYVYGDKKVVLGLVTTKSPKLEDAADSN